MFRIMMYFVFSCALAASAAASPMIPGDPNSKPEDPTYTPTRTIFDCSAPDTLTIDAGFTQTFEDSTIGRPTDLDTYPCKDWNEYGPEHVYRLEITGDLVFTAFLTREGEEPEDDLDLFLLNDCDSDSCLAFGNISLSADLAPGTYFLVVDTWSGDPEPVPGLTYELEIAARWPGIPPGPCSGGSIGVACGDSTFAGDLFDKPDLVRGYDCSPDVTLGGEDWYQVDSPALRVMKLDVQARSVGLDPVLWIFDGCGPDADCLGYVNKTIAFTGAFNDGSGHEILDWRQESELPATVWVVVDCVLPPLAEGDGDYDVTIDCRTVPGEGKSFGSLRALYR